MVPKMAAFIIQDYEFTGGTTPSKVVMAPSNMTFGQSFGESSGHSLDQSFGHAYPNTPPVPREGVAAEYDYHHLVSPPCLVSTCLDEQGGMTPHLVAPCSGEDSVAGDPGDVEREYDVEPRVLGTGHHGSVRGCVHRATGRRYAIKSIRKGDPSVKPAGLAREIELLDEMKHGNIIELIDVYEDGDYVHLITDLCEGGELFDKVVERSAADNGAACFREEEAARIMYQVLTAVSYMHDHDIVHRDIKPENILFVTGEEDSQIKIIDFGLSRKYFSGKDPPMSTVVGTPYYIAPEVLRKRYSKSCDLWSAGVIAYILLCGYPPFNGVDSDHTHRSVLRGRYCFPAEEWNSVSVEAVDFICRLLRTDPRRRMAVGQALNHPWMVKHVNVDVLASEEERQDNSSVEVLYNETPRKHPVTRVDGDSPPRRKVRMSMFGL